MQELDPVSNNSQNETHSCGSPLSTCKDCSGDGSVECFGCHGSGISERECMKCKGTGDNLPCWSCHGSGKTRASDGVFECRSCSGSGKSQPRGGSHCLICKGHGTFKEQCYYCKGSGYRKCSACNGTKIICESCRLKEAEAEKKTLIKSTPPKIAQTIQPTSQEQDSKRVSFLLALGIFLAPYIFSWVTLRDGYSRASRFISLGWLTMLVVLRFIKSH